MNLNTLAISHSHKGGNRIFEDYCYGVKSNSNKYFYIDYIDLYTNLGKKCFENNILNLINDQEINCVFFFLWARDFTFDIYFIEKISKLTKIIMMFSDTYYSFEECDRYYAQLSDLVILPEYLMKYQYELLGINAITTFSLFNKDFYKREGIKPKNIDVSFVGNIRKTGRKEYIDYLTTNDIKVESYGRYSNNGFVDFNKMIYILNQSKINLNFTGAEDYRELVFSKKIINLIKIVPGRIIEVAFCGGFVLTEYAPGMEYLFEIGKEIDVFRSKEELVEKIKFYLENDQKREEMADKCYKRAISNYDSTAAFKRILDDFQKITKKEKALVLDNIFLKNYVAYRTIYFARFLSKFKLKHFFEEMMIVFKIRKISIHLFYLFTVYCISLICCKSKKV